MREMAENPQVPDDPEAPVQRAVQTDVPQRDAKGKFLPGNRASVMTALRAGRAHLPEVFRVLEDKARDFLEQSITDDGGPGELSERRKAQHSYRAVLHLNILRMNAALETHGLFDRRGKLRVLWLDKLTSLIREARATDVLLGLDRRTRDLGTVTLRDYLAMPPSSSPVAPGDAPATTTGTDTGPTHDAPATAQDGQTT